MTAPLTILLWLMFFAGGTADVTVVTLADGSALLPLAPAGRVDLKREGTVTRVRVELNRLSPPIALGTAYNTYVVWAVSPEGSIENIGAILVDKDKGRLEATSRFEQIGLLITAEPHYMVDRPSMAVAFRTQNPRREDIRTQSVALPIGFYDYTSIQSQNQATLAPLVIQARVAFQIAKNAQADRLAEPEYRQAKVAIDTMEEMVSRASPLDIVSRAGNEVIRRSQQAVTSARERQAAVSLDSALNDNAGLKQQIQSLNARVEQLAAQQNVTNAQVQKLQSDLALANRENQRLADERDQAMARDRTSSRELSETKKNQDGLRSQLNFQLRDEFYDFKSESLSLVGRDALARLHGIALAVPGQVQIQGPAPDALFEAARQYLLQAGLSADRIMLKR